jgi:hypothetical protein
MLQRLTQTHNALHAGHYLALGLLSSTSAHGVVVDHLLLFHIDHSQCPVIVGDIDRTVDAPLGQNIKFLGPSDRKIMTKEHQMMACNIIIYIITDGTVYVIISIYSRICIPSDVTVAVSSLVNEFVYEERVIVVRGLAARTMLTQLHISSHQHAHVIVNDFIVQPRAYI